MGLEIYLEYFRKKKLDALGVDLSEGFIHRCEQRGFNVRRMDMENILLYPHFFDGIWAHAVLIHIPHERAEKTIQSWVKLLKRDGLLFLSAREGNTEGFERGEFDSQHQRWFSYYTDDEIRKWVTKKFDIVHFERGTNTDGKVWLKYWLRLK